MTTSAVAYSADLGTTKTLATIQGVVAGTYYGMGKLPTKKSPCIMSQDNYTLISSIIG